MADDPTEVPEAPQEHLTQEQTLPPGTASTNIEALQELKAQEGNAAAKEQALRQLLSLLDPHPQDTKLTPRQVLERLENVIARELQAQKE